MCIDITLGNHNVCALYKGMKSLCKRYLAIQSWILSYYWISTQEINQSVSDILKAFALVNHCNDSIFLFCSDIM